jgi:hypothetical protein
VVELVELPIASTHCAGLNDCQKLADCGMAGVERATRETCRSFGAQ